MPRPEFSAATILVADDNWANLEPPYRKALYPKRPSTWCARRSKAAGGTLRWCTGWKLWSITQDCRSPSRKSN